MPVTQVSVQAERMMARLNLSTYGIRLETERFRELLVDLFHGHYRAISSVDELLVRPRQALRYCDLVRDALGAMDEPDAYDLPDDVILRTLLNLRKQGA